MRIAQISPLYESVPPKLYGGTERVVHYITEELVRQGHDVTLFASGDSVTSARLVSPCRKALRLDPESTDPIVNHITMMEMVERHSEEFDIIHSHIDYLYYPLIRRSRVPHVTTLHGRQNMPELKTLYKEFRDIPVISISDFQRTPIPYANWKGTVYHGLPTDLYSYNPDGGNYLTFLGRISPEKRVDRAIEIAIRAGIPIKIAAKVDKADNEYFEGEIRQLLDHPLVDFIGEIGEKEKEEFLGNSMGLLYPIDWPEPFGLAMIESMACGTPAIAYGQGSIPEIIDEGITGFIVNSIEEAVSAVGKLSGISRPDCRGRFEERFSSRRMAEEYLSIYSTLVKESERRNNPAMLRNKLTA